MNDKKVTDLNYLTDTMGERKPLMKEVMAVFLKHFPQEIKDLNYHIEKETYSEIKYFSHRMKSSSSIMGIKRLSEVLEQIEGFARGERDIHLIKKLNSQVNSIGEKAIEEIKLEIKNY